jgi:tetratricopeptide (TPR) repeat protein
MHFALVGAVAGLALSAGGARAQEDEDIYEDEIVRLAHAPVIGVKITKDNWKIVFGKMEIEGGDRESGITVPASDVMEIVYADASPDLLRGFQREKRGYYTQAITKSFEPTLKKVDAFRKLSDSKKPWPLQYCLYYLGVCHLKRGKPGDATKARGYFDRLVKEVPESRFIFGAYTGTGDSLQVEKKYTAAAEAFARAQERFEKMSRTLGLDMQSVAAIRKRALMAHYRKGEMLSLAGQHDKAVSVFNVLAANARRDYPAIYFLARSAAIKSLVSTKAYKLAIQKARELIDEGERKGYTEFLGGAYLGLADCYFAQYTDAEAKGDGADPNGLVVARYNYLRVLALYFEDRTVLPKAHFRSGRCYERLAQAGEGDKAVDRAVRHYSRIADEWPDSAWSKEAKSRLTALGRSMRKK